MLIKKINLILCILIALVFVGQMYMIVVEPFFLMQETEKEFSVKEADAGQVPYPHEISLFEMVWLNFHDSAAVVGAEYGGWGDNLTAQLEELGEYEGRTTEDGRPISAEQAFEDDSNYYVMGVVGVTVLGLVMGIMTIFTQKNIAHYAFTLAWAAVSVWAFWCGNPVVQKLGMPYAYGTVLPTLKVLTIAGVVLTLARAYPWVYTRFIAKKVKK